MEVGKFEFALQTLNSFGLPDFKGSTFRGKFGHVLKRTICVISHHNCEICELRGKCAYPYLFETNNQRGQNVPRPFVLEPPLTHKRFYLKEEWMYLNLVLMGQAIDYLPYFIHVFDRMGEEGIGRDRGRYRVASVRALDGQGNKQEIYDGESRKLSGEFRRIDLDGFTGSLLPQATLNFLTPTDIRAEGERVDTLGFPVLLKNILRRYHSLRYYHGDGRQERFEIDWAAAGKIEILHQDLTNNQFKRFSNRQKQPVLLAGFTGTITYRGELSPFLPWLKVGELLHVGKGTVFGMGWYRVMG